MSENNEADAVICIGVPIHAACLPLILAQVTAPLMQANHLLGQDLFCLDYLPAPGQARLPPLPLARPADCRVPQELLLCPGEAEDEPATRSEPAPQSAPRSWPLPLHSPAAALHSILQLIDHYESEALAQQVAQQFGCHYQPQSSGGERRGEAPLPPRLKQALALMADHLDEPLGTEEIAGRTHLSRRHLERLFRRHLDTMPARHYLQLRLQRAKELLCNSHLSIVQVGLECGFSSGPHFSSAYKNHFQLTPRDERQNALSKK